MKKINYCVLAGLFLSLLFLSTGCEKEPIPEEPVIPGSKPSIQITVSPSDSVELNGSASLSYHTSNGDSATINGVSAPLSGCINIILKKDTTFSFNVKNKFGQTTEVRNIFVKKEVVNNPLPTMVLSVSPSTALPVGGGVATISWITENADIVYHDNIGYGSTGSVITDWITTDTTLSFMAVGPGGNRTFYRSVNVELPPDPIFVLFGKMIASWKFSGLAKSYDLVTWENIPLVLFQTDDIWIFNQNHTATIDHGTNRVGNQTQFTYFQNWNLEVDSTISGFVMAERKLISVNETTLEVVFESIEVTIKPDGTNVITPIYWKEILYKE